MTLLLIIFEMTLQIILNYEFSLFEFLRRREIGTLWKKWTEKQFFLLEFNFLYEVRNLFCDGIGKGLTK